MPVSQAEVLQWCRTMQEESSDFPSLEECLNHIPDLDSLNDLPSGTRVLVRGDVDVKVKDDGSIKDDTRLRSLLDTLEFCHSHGFVALVYGHMGRDPELSLGSITDYLANLLKSEKGIADASVTLVPDWLDPETGEVLGDAQQQVAAAKDGAILVLENTRKYALERAVWKENADELEANCQKITNYANTVAERLGKVHVNEGFAASNPDLSSVVVPYTMERIALGAYISDEIRTHLIRTRLAELVVFSGIKIQKLDDLQQILDRGKVRMVIAAGSLAIALMKAQAMRNGEEMESGLASDPEQKIYIPDERIAQAEAMLENGEANGVEFVLPVDYMLQDGTASDVIPPGGAQLDVGPKTREHFAAKIGEFIEYHKQKMASQNMPAVAFHNGVFGMFEKEEFSHGTREFMSQLKRMCEAGVQVYVGGGEGGAALKEYGSDSWVTHCFTAGGTILKALGTQPIPYIKALTLKAKG